MSRVLCRTNKHMIMSKWAHYYASCASCKKNVDFCINLWEKNFQFSIKTIFVFFNLGISSVLTFPAFCVTTNVCCAQNYNLDVTNSIHSNKINLSFCYGCYQLNLYSVLPVAKMFWIPHNISSPVYEHFVLMSVKNDANIVLVVQHISHLLSYKTVKGINLIGFLMDV